MTWINKFWKDEQGQSLVEYSLLLVLIAVAAMIAITAMGQSVTQIFTKITQKLDGVANSAS